MPCFRPLKGYRSATINPDTKKRSIVFNARLGNIDMPIDLPCNQCMGCRLKRSRDWAIRMVHEASLHKKNTFLTLTYSDDKLPRDRGLNVKDFQDFMKRLRFHHGPMRFFHCGEYGEKTLRPHYHAAIFGFEFSDMRFLKKFRGNTYKISDDLSALWPHGNHVIGDLNFETAAYVARYVTKKQTGPKSDVIYEWTDYETGEIFSRAREYATMSRRPGIAKPWLDKLWKDVYPSDQVVLTGPNGARVFPPPRSYDRIFEVAYPAMFSRIKKSRKKKAADAATKNPDPRLAAREYCQELKAERLKRNYENDS